ncbi:aminotransferase class I/II-fold pyridoxal phosphate-dependent enzyme [Pectinatus sottacetonis]|uniref:aminotransferase class I/II-fold pyridoxal phosphate-dependent enzyme n=1 Tax=Pectinatus sottacetonis TaxID=1002795 RepID=UPI0018C6F072|nr:aminotransferase class V-fold PLP-dependent enzyme [Pectinatus sottacetonis]
MNQNIAPLFEAMGKYVADGAIAFHTPGHKQGKVVPTAIRKIITPLGLKMDVSLMDELDDLFEPGTCIKEAQELAAELYGADETLFMVNGTTGAIHVMILSAVAPGDKIIIPRNAHKSVLGALILCGAVPVFIEPFIDEKMGIAMGVTEESVQNILQKNPDAKALLLVYPTYYGVACNIKKIAKMVHDAGMLLLVDEAHGPHLKFSSHLPIQAIDAGADMAAQSTHKILASVTQTSMLHVSYKRIRRERVHMMNAVIQTTSPNYLFLSALDTVRRQMAQSGKVLINRAYELAQQLRKNINTINGLYCFGDDIVGSDGIFALDYTKITVTVKQLGITGYKAEQILRHKYKIQCELADMYNVLFIISLADSNKETAILLKSLSLLAYEYAQNNAPLNIKLKKMPLPKMIIPPQQAVYEDYTTIPFNESKGCLCAETITFYPPGIPLIYPGEVISSEIIEYIIQGRKYGGKVVGPFDNELNTIRVIK